MNRKELIEAAVKNLHDQKLSYLTNEEMIIILERIFKKKIHWQWLISLSEFFDQTNKFANDHEKLKWRLWTLISVLLRLTKNNSSCDFKKLMKIIEEVTV